MSDLYGDLIYTKFPNELDDSYEYMQDLTSDLIDLASQYESLINSKKFSEAAQLLLDNPSLNRIYFNAEKYNKLIDSIRSIQRLYKNDVQTYILELVQYKGEYSNSQKYTKYNVVNYNSMVYMCTSLDCPLGTEPTNTDYWYQLSIKGDQGQSGLGLAFIGVWSASTTYSEDDAVSYGTCLYASTEDNNLAHTPSKSSSSYWNLIIDFSDITGYDNSSSGLQSTSLQGAVDELNTKIITNESNISTNTNDISTINNDISTINNDISTINNNISSLETSINNNISSLRTEMNNNLTAHDSPIATESGAHGFRYYQNELQYKNNGNWTIIDTGSGGSYVGTSAPSDTELLWIDTANGGVLKYYNGSAWTNIKAVWG